MSRDASEMGYLLKLMSLLNFLLRTIKEIAERRTIEEIAESFSRVKNYQSLAR